MRLRKLTGSKHVPVPCSDPEEGSQVVSYALVQVLVLLLMLGAMQLAITLHIRNVSVYAAGEGARRGALLGGDETEAHARTQQLLDEFAGSGEGNIVVTRDGTGEEEVLTVTVTTTLPVLLHMGPQWLTVRGRALVEVSP